MKATGNIILQMLSGVVDLIIVGTLWIICSLGIVTIGASTTAAYYVMVKCVRQKTGYITKEFFKCFKDNFKPATALSGISLGVAAVLGVDFYFIYCNPNSLTISLGIILLFFSAYVIEVFMFMFPLLSRFDNSVGYTIKVSAALVMKYLFVAIAILLVFLLTIAGILAMPPLIIILPGLYVYFKTYPMEWIMRKFMPKVDPNSEEAEEWYNKR